MGKWLLSVLALAFLVAGTAFAATYEPAPSPGTNQSCSYLYWFDNNTKVCGYKQFCGTYMYYGLQTFTTKEECEKALKNPIACTADVKQCSDGSYVTRDPYNNCQFKPCPGETQTVPELVKCVFYNSNTNQKCYTTDGQFACSGTETCVADVYGAKGQKLTWKSTCGGYAYTTIDGTNKYAEFKCEGGDCKYLYWFDNYAKACGYQKFCGAYIYYGLQTFGTYEECAKALGSGGQAIEQPNVVVSQSGSGGVSITTYSVGICPVKEQPVACTMEYAPVCATIERFSTDGSYTKYKKTFSNACMACAASSKTALVVEYVSGACDQDTGIDCPIVSMPLPEFCPNGKILPKYGEIESKKCILSYYCSVYPENQAPVSETPVFIYSSYGGLANMEINLYVYQSGALVKKEIVEGQMKKMSGQTSSENVAEFLKNLDAKGFFDLKMTEPSCCATTQEGVSMCVYDASTQKMFARHGEKQNSVAWCLLVKEPEAIIYALKMVQEFESLLQENTTKYVSLGKIFDLLLGEKAVVKETGLQAKLASIEQDSAIFLVKSQAMPLSSVKTVSAEAIPTDQWVKIKAGESTSAFGHTISLNSILFPKCLAETDSKTGETTTKCYGAKPYANLTITKQEPEKEKTAYPGEKFEIKVGEKATILDLIKIYPPKKLLWVSLEGIDRPVDCPVQEKCKEGEKCIQIWCNMRARARLLISIPSGTDVTETAKFTPLAIMEGETKTFGEYRIYFAGFSGENAVFVVNRISDDLQYVKVSLGEEFKLQEQQTALIVDKDIFVTLIKSVPGAAYMAEADSQPYPPQTGYAVVSVWKKGWGVVPVPLAKEAMQKIETIKENMKNAGIESNIREMNTVSSGASGAVFYKKTYILKLGESLKIYDIKLALLGLAEGSAKFLADEMPYGDTINVQVGEPFKLKENMKARVLEANLLIQLLGISHEETVCTESDEGVGTCTMRPVVKIGVSNYLFEKGKIGTTVSSRQISENAKSDIIEPPEKRVYPQNTLPSTVPDTTVVSSGAIAIEQPIAIEPPVQAIPVKPIEIPAPFGVYKLREGESVAVGGFEITVKAIWVDYAEFIVTEKGTGLEFKISIAKGWNLFSIPGEIKTLGLNNCSLGDFRLFEYIDGKFEKAKKAESGKAYWLYNPKEACTIKIELVKPVSLFELKPLHKGWNFVPVLQDLFGKQIGKMGDCRLKGAFFYDTEGKQWVKALETMLGKEHLGKALAVYAEEKCILAGPDIPIPEMPALPELPEVG